MRVKGLVEVRTGDAHCNGNWHSVWKMGNLACSLVVSYDNLAKRSGRSGSVKIEFYMAYIDGSTFEGSDDFTAGGLPAQMAIATLSVAVAFTYEYLRGHSNPLVPASSWWKNLTALVANAKISLSAVMEMPNRVHREKSIALEVERGKSKEETGKR